MCFFLKEKKPPAFGELGEEDEEEAYSSPNNEEDKLTEAMLLRPRL